MKLLLTAVLSLALTTVPAFALDPHVEATKGEVEKIGESQSLELVDLPDERLPVLKDFAFLKSICLAPVKKLSSDEVQAKIKVLLPKMQIQFI